MPTAPTSAAWARIPRIDLWRQRAVELSLSYDADFSRQLETELPEVLTSDKPFLSVTSYTKAGRRHDVTGLILHSEVRPNKVDVSLRYDTSVDAQTRVVPRTLRRDKDLLARLNGLEVSSNIQCKVVFDFDEGAATNLWFPLPARLRGRNDDDAIYELLGIQVARLSRPDSNAVDYLFELERYRGRNLRLVIFFHLSGEVRSTLPARILARGASVARDMIGADG